ncbi:hypothetical protein ACFZC5_33795 [Nocardia gamkensis]|uniref:hypothetical protein n=1 Tax=Nocardia gamkensis TaxID=352869 RepID=UPI0036E86E89
MKFWLSLIFEPPHSLSIADARSGFTGPWGHPPSGGDGSRCDAPNMRPEDSPDVASSTVIVDE